MITLLILNYPLPIDSNSVQIFYFIFRFLCLIALPIVFPTEIPNNFALFCIPFDARKGLYVFSFTSLG